MCTRKTLFFLLSLCASLLTTAQTSQLKKLLPMIAPASPDAASLGKFGTYQVSLFTGVPDISIPIYQVQVGELKLPISLSYHASGIKVSELPSRVGLGWTLNPGGIITRSIRGLPDEQVNNYFSATSTSDFRVKVGAEIEPNTSVGLDYLGQVNAKKYDVEPDIFSYSFPGGSGKFLFNQRDSFKAYLIPYAPIAVNKTQVNPYLVNFSLKDEAGRKYLYNTTETTSSGSGVGLQANTTSAWLMSEMVSANGQDSVHFRYSSVGTTDQYQNEYEIVNDNVTGAGYYNGDQGTFSGEIVGVSTNGAQLDEINFPGGKVVFQAAAETRTDLNGVYSLANRLKYIKVYGYDAATNTYVLLKTFQLFHSSFINGTDNRTARLRLDSVQLQTSTSTNIQTYRFSYNTSVFLPDNLSTQKDFWGYFNNNSNTKPGTNTPTSIPKMQIDYNIPPNPSTKIWIGGTDTNARYPNPTYNQAYILQQITYPTGGYTQFTYETNQYLDDNGVPKYAGGLRVKTIKSYDGVNNPLVKTYKYGTGESGYGRANFVLGQYFFADHQSCRFVDIHLDPLGQCMLPFGTKTMSTYFANPTNDLEGWDGAPVVYATVTEYEGDETANIGKTIYQYSDKPDAKTTAIGYGRPYYDSYHFVRGLLTNKSVYRNNGDGSYTIVSEERKKYQYFPYQWSSGGVGLIVTKKLVDQGDNGDIDNIGTNYGYSCQPFSDANNYNYTNYNIVSGDNKLIADTNIIYDQLSTARYAATTSTYTYDDLTHLGLTQVQAQNSRGEVLQTNYTYPYTGSAYPSMDAQHIWDKIVTETKYNNSLQLTKTTTNYTSFAGNNYLPSSIQVQVKTNPVETRASFNSYDFRGNVLEMQKTNDAKQAFIWGYKNLNVIAEVFGASQSEIACTSFEADGAGGWSGVNQPGFVNNGCITGKRAYTQTNFSFSKAGLNAAGSYTVSYWSKNGAYAVNGTTGISLRSFNGWTLYQHPVTNPVSGTVTVSGSGTIDELRLYPSTAQMKTYTYEPLVGVSSVCEINNRITYYFYDGIGRLLLVKDDNNNIVKQFCYNYQGQDGICSIYGNAVQSGSFTKNNCTSGTGTTVTYSVPANTFYANAQADANTLALNEANVAGQAYANASGSCSAPLYTVTGTDSKSIGYTVTFKQPGTSTIVYSFSLAAGDANKVFTQQVAAGTYDIQFQPGGMPETANFYVNTLSMTGVNAATFYNVSISGNTTITVN